MTNKTKNAFTLAEVLITLVIVGIVATLTISSVINTYVERATVSKVKKGLSTLAQAKKLAEAQNGSVMGWDFEGAMSSADANKFWRYIKPYFSLARDCGSAHNCRSLQASINYLNGNLLGNYHSFDSTYYKFALADGSVMWFRTTAQNGKCNSTEGNVQNNCAIFFYDVNGDKGPNVLGRDVFLYEFTINGVYPSKINDCNKNSNGWGCAAYIIKHSNMNYLH